MGPGVGESECGAWRVSIVIWQNVSRTLKISLDMILPILGLKYKDRSVPGLKKIDFPFSVIIHSTEYSFAKPWSMVIT